MKIASFALVLAALVACGRNTQNADVRLVGVGSDPDQIGPSPTPYGGVVEYNNLELAGGGLALAHMGLGSFDEVGPGGLQFAPPYRAIVGFSYLFDQKLPAADTLSFTAPVPPVNEDTCYTVFSPEGPIGSFNTVDVGDGMEFVSVSTAGEKSSFRMGRVPYDIPPDAQDLFIYYSNVESWAPTARVHKVPDPSSSDPRQMTAETYLLPNYPFGQEMIYRFPGGIKRFDHPISSIPRPSTTVEGASLTLPNDVSARLAWSGPRYDSEGEATDGDWSQCLEFYGDGRETDPASADDCASTASVLPNSKAEFDSFSGQIYTGPWDTADGKLELEWTPGAGDEQVTFSVRFLAEPDQTDANYQVAMHGDRAATPCEEADATFESDEAIFESPAMKGDPFSRTIEVSCLLADDGSHDIDAAWFAEALEYAATHDIGGAIFYFGRGTEAEIDVPAAKDPYDQRHDISPIAVTSRALKMGRFHWDDTAASGGGQ